MMNPAETNGTIVAALGADGVIRVTAKGFLSDETFGTYFKEIKGLLAKCRAENANVRMLVDVTDGTVQSAATIEGYSLILNDLGGPADKIAVITPSALAKMQSDRIGASHDNYRAFVSARDAERWLVGS